LRELEIEAGGLGEEEARQARIEAHEQALAAYAAERLAIEADLTLSQEAQTEAADEAYRRYLETLIALNEILGVRTDTVKVEQDLLTILRRQLRNMQALVGLINQAFDGMISLLEATGAVGENFAKAAHGVRQMTVGLLTFTKHLDVLGETRDHIRELETSIADMKEKFGEAVEGVKEYNDALKQLETAKGLKFEALGGMLSGGFAIAGGVAALASVFAQQETESQRIHRKNIEALDQLRHSIDNLRGTFDVSGADFVNAQRAFEKALGGQRRVTLDPVGFRQIYLPRIREALLELGLTFKDLDRLAEEFGITIRDSAGNIIPRGINDLLAAIEEAEKALIGFPDTLEGAMREAGLTAQLYDLEDPALQFAAQMAGIIGAGAEFTAWLNEMNAQGRNAADAIGEWQEIMRGWIAGGEKLGKDLLEIPALAELFNLDLTTAEGRAQAEQLIRELFRQFQLGELDIEALGFTTPQEFLDFLAGMEGLLDQMDEAAETMGETQDVRRQVSITELQANQLLAYQSTQTEIQRRIEGILEQIRDSLGLGATFTPIEPPPMPISSDELANWPDFQRMLDAFESGAPSIEVDMTIEQILIEGGISTEDQAREFATTASDELRRQLGEAYKKNRRLKGLSE
jgi:glycosyltransferase A (GT-A) superfamily protein (DUF2064 family)